MANLSNSIIQANTTTTRTTDPKSFYRMVVGAFTYGDTVLCPMTGEGIKTYVLKPDPYQQSNLLALSDTESIYYFDSNGFFVRASDTETQDFVPSLFHDTPANRQAIATLYPTIAKQSASTPIPTKRKVIDGTKPDDKEVITISAWNIVNLASDLSNVIEVLNDIGLLLAHIHYKKIDPSMTVSMVRLAHESTGTWVDLLHTELDALNEVIEQTSFNKVEVAE